MCIQRLNDGSPGWDNITSKIIKAPSNHVVRPLTHIFNLSSTTGVFPTELKIARVSPLFKGGVLITDPFQCYPFFLRS